MSSKSSPSSSAARAAIAQLQQAWQARAWAEVAGLYHPDAQLLPTDLGPAISGREAIVASYQEFMQLAELHRFDVRESRERCYQHTCIVQCECDIEYVLDGLRMADQVTEIYVLEHDAAGALHIIWRQQIVNSSRSFGND